MQYVVSSLQPPCDRHAQVDIYHGSSKGERGPTQSERSPAAQRVSDKHSIMRVRIDEGRTMAVEEGARAECAICGNGFMHPVIFASRRQFGTRSTRATKAQCLK
jgi:hypothetical protein